MSPVASPLLDSLLQLQPGNEVSSAARRGSRALLAQVGLPTARDEAWRYTSLRSLASKTFALQDAEAGTRALPESLHATISPAALRLVFVNGVLRRDLSKLDTVPQGMQVGVAASESATQASLEPANAFVAANLALAQSGATIRISAGAKIETPLHLFFVSLPTVVPVAAHTRISIELGSGAGCTLIEQHLSETAAAHLCNRVLDIELGEGARLTHTRQTAASTTMNSIHSSRYRLGRGATVEAFELTPGQSLNRHQVDVELIGDGARFVSGGVQALNGRAHADVQLSVQHRARDTSCDLIWRGIADQRARLGFTGNLHVDAGADGADAKLSSKNLLLSANAEINTRPVLVIHADEVKAAHGATVGRLDERALFYLRSRGIPMARARVMLTHAFAIEALQALSDETLRAQMSTALRDAMAGFVGDDADER
jgi:Fe-S cluster assembly protein SufD